MTYIPNAIVSSTYAKIKIRNHVEKIVWHIYSRESKDGYGKSDLISVEDLNDESKGYLVEDTIVLELASLLCVTETKFIDSI
ncbi:hypothetical protein V5N11_021712 [Cardamine amara subsp. amara]|uniref:MATH domain-containing protein n=1 Tax=Cardamine amara subsp. amara TaxID=228776 RepID=A0ABD1BS03_CARAN